MGTALLVLRTTNVVTDTIGLFLFGNVVFLTIRHKLVFLHFYICYRGTVRGQTIIISIFNYITLS